MAVETPVLTIRRDGRRAAKDCMTARGVFVCDLKALGPIGALGAE